MTTVQDVADEMASIANSNISDPNTYRSESGDKWIYSHFPQYGEDATLPRIGFHPVGEEDIPATLGSTATNTEGDIQATIVVRRGKKYDYDNDGNVEQEENLLYYLKEQVKNAMKNNQSQLTGLQDVSYVVPLNTAPRRPENGPLFLAYTFEVRINNC